MKYALSLILLATMIGCKGPAGSKGDTGAQGLTGLPGPSGNTTNQITTYTGDVTSNTQVIAIPAYTTSSIVIVYGFISPSYIQLPVYNITHSVNVMYAASTGLLTLYNAQVGGMTTYKIMVVN